MGYIYIYDIWWGVVLGREEGEGGGMCVLVEGREGRSRYCTVRSLVCMYRMV